MKADELRNLISATRDAIASLRGCTKAERDNEARILRNVLEELRRASLSRRNADVERRRAAMIENAERILAEFGLSVVVDLTRKPTAAELADPAAMDRRAALQFAGTLGHCVVSLRVDENGLGRRKSAECNTTESALRFATPGDEIYESLGSRRWRLVYVVGATPARNLEP